MVNSPILSECSKLLEVALNNLNTNKISKNFGNFDRNYWHYKVIDFPSGMMQTYFYALALAYNHRYPNLEKYYKNPKMHDWILASLNNTVKIFNKNGSLDDYYPKEQAIGATTFVIINFIKTIKLLKINSSKYKKFLSNVGNFISRSNESGTLSNHKAAEILALILINNTLKKNLFKISIEKKIKELMNNFNNEGWFQEYEGCDLGYSTVTISRLMDIYLLTKRTIFLEKAEKCIDFCTKYLQPDYSLGGNYTSRSTKINFTDGFAKYSSHNKKSLKFINAINKQITLGNSPFYKDDQIACHHLISYLETEKIVNSLKIKTSHFNKIFNQDIYSKESGLLKRKIGNFLIFIGTKKGGLFNLYKNNDLIYEDSGIIFRHNKKIYLSNGQFGSQDIVFFDNGLELINPLYFYKEEFMTTSKLLILRFVMTSFGKFFPNLIRYLLQKLLINRKKDLKLKLKRSFLFEKSQITLKDEVIGVSNGEIELLENTNTAHIVMSNVFNKYFFTNKNEKIIKKKLSIIRKIK